jgi:ADP-ribose pyrophosphatase YjhB (NUDIX family)
MLTCTFEHGETTTNLRHLVVHAIVEKDGLLLLGKRHQSLLEGGKFGLPGGFVDRNEDVSQAVLRELYEETGWEGHVERLLRLNSNPLRRLDDRQNISIDFIVIPTVQSGTPDWESTELKWEYIDENYNFDSLAFDHGDSIRLYLDWKKRQFGLPIIQ